MSEEEFKAVLAKCRRDTIDQCIDACVAVEREGDTVDYSDGAKDCMRALFNLSLEGTE